MDGSGRPTAAVRLAPEQRPLRALEAVVRLTTGDPESCLIRAPTLMFLMG